MDTYTVILAGHEHSCTGLYDQYMSVMVVLCGIHDTYILS